MRQSSAMEVATKAFRSVSADLDIEYDSIPRARIVTFLEVTRCVTRRKGHKHLAGDEKEKMENVKIEMFACKRRVRRGEKRVQNCLGTHFFSSSIRERKLCQNHFSPFHLATSPTRFSIHIV